MFLSDSEESCDCMNVQDIIWNFHPSMDHQSLDAESCVSTQTALLRVCLGEGGRSPSVSAAEGENVPAALAFAASTALQAMMLGLASAPSEAANSPFWKVRIKGLHMMVCTVSVK